jgi:hypothetical protein
MLNLIWRMSVEKLALIVTTVGTVFWASTANAGWWDPYGSYHPTCYWVSNDKQQPKVEEKSHDANQKQSVTKNETPEGNFACY